MIRFIILAFIASLGLISCSNKSIYGVDLSHHNTVTDWNKVTASFIYAKATEGTTIQDSKFSSFVKEAQKRNILVGAYHFMTTSSSAESQFENFKNATKDFQMDLIPVLDIERQTKGYSISKSELRKNVRTFVDLCKKHYGKTPIIYCSQGFYIKNFKGNFKDCMYWCGDVNSVAVLPHVIHQSTIKQVPGIAGKVDYNTLNCELNKLKL